MRQDHATYNISVRSADLDLDCGEALALDVDEKILLHGTSYNNASSIISEGFDHRTCQSALYGLGVYFACAACKSDQYTLEHDHLGRTLIIARVALGDSYVARETRLNQRATRQTFRWNLRFHCCETWPTRWTSKPAAGSPGVRDL